MFNERMRTGTVSSVDSEFIGSFPPGLEDHAGSVEEMDSKTEGVIASNKSTRPPPPDYDPPSDEKASIAEDTPEDRRRRLSQSVSELTIDSTDAEASMEKFESWSRRVDEQMAEQKRAEEDHPIAKRARMIRTLERLRDRKNRFASETHEILKEQIQRFDAEIRAEIVRAEEYKQTFEKTFERVKSWAAPLYVSRAKLVSDRQHAFARLSGLEEGIRVQLEGMRSIDALAQKQVDATKDRLKRVFRNTDALARSLNLVETDKPHNEYLELSIYLWQKYLSDATQTCTQASEELVSKDADIAQFKLSELRDLHHQSEIEIKLLTDNVARENAVLDAEFAKVASNKPSPDAKLSDPAHAEAMARVDALEATRDRKLQALESVENHLRSMKRNRHALEREVQELSIALKTMWPSSEISVNIAEQQLRQIEAFDRKRKELEANFRDRLNTAMTETKLAEEIKWRNRHEVAVRSADHAIRSSGVSEKANMKEMVAEVGNKYQGQFEDRVSKLHLEKEEHSRLARVRSARVLELQTDLERIEDMKSRLRAIFEKRTQKHNRLLTLKERFRHRWHESETITSEEAEKFLLRVQWTMDFTPSMIDACRSNMRTLRTMLPMIRSSRADIRQRERIVRLIIGLTKFVANPNSADASTLQIIDSLGLVLPDPRSSAAAQHLEFETLRDSLKQTYEDLTSELLKLDDKLLATVEALESSSTGYIFKYRGVEYKEIVRRQDSIAKRPVDWAQWESQMRSRLPRIRRA